MPIAAATSPAPAPTAQGAPSDGPGAPPAYARAASLIRFVRDTPPLYLVTLAVVIGDALGNVAGFVPLWIAAAVGAAAAIMFTLGQRATGTMLAFLAIAGAATASVQPLLEPPDGPTSLNRFTDDAVVTVEGYLTRAAERVAGERDRQRLYLHVERAGAPNTPLMPTGGMVRLTTSETRGFHLGDELRVTARLRIPRSDGNPDEFDYRDWLLRGGIAATMYAEAGSNDPAPLRVVGHRRFIFATPVESIRERIGAFIDANLRYPANAELRALIIGDRGGIGEPLRQRFALTGMAHLLVISGLHLGFLATAAFFVTLSIAGFFPAVMARGYANKSAAAVAALAVCAYAAIAGHHVSTIRALIMVLSYALAIIIDRSRELISSLALAALIICLTLPASTADIGFQLSFASVLVILLGMRRFTAWWRWRYMNPLAPPAERSRLNVVAEVIVGYVAVSFWAMLGTAPLTAFHFNQFSLVGLIANAVVVPIMGFGAVICGLLAAGLSFVSIPLARGPLWLAGQLAGAGTSLAGWFVAWPLAWARVFTPTVLELAIVYGFLLLWLTAPLKGEALRRQLRDKVPPATTLNQPARSLCWRGMSVAMLGTALLLDAGWWIRQRYFDTALRITFLAVGEGDAAVVRFPGSRVMLVDGGGAFGGAFDPGERIVAPFLWSQKIMHVDYVTVSHPDRDHFGGLIFIAQNFSPAAFWTSGVASGDASYVALLDAVAKAGARSRICNSAAAPVLVGGVTLRCVGPLATLAELKENNSSMVIRMSYGPATVLFAGDVEAKGERALLASGADLRATILKVPHHGSHTSSSPPFIAAVAPAVAVISLGYHNRFKFPAAEVLERYRAAGVTVMRTDDDGAISFSNNGGVLRLWSVRHGPVRLPAIPQRASR